MTASRTILLIEDDAGIRESVAECLASEGYEVVTAANGEEGLELLRAAVRTPDLVVLDLVMPVMNGTQFLAALHADGRLRDVPVVLMTAAMPSGGMSIPEATAYLSKPFELDELLDAVARHSGPAGA